MKKQILLLFLLTSTLSLDMRMLQTIEYIKNRATSPVPLNPFFTKRKPEDYAGEISNKLENCPDSYIEHMVVGYPFESHRIETEDGYILTAFRMQAKGTTIKNGLPPVFMNHGINSDANCFLINDEDKSLAKIMANAGFDVWLGNNRGNKFSRRHKTLKITSKEFWQFSF